MALDATVTLVPGFGHYYTAPAGTAFPANPKSPASPWSEVGHTTSDNPLQVSTDGGDVTVLRSWQSAALRTTRDPIVKTYAFNLLQYDAASLKLYYGSNATTDTNGNIVEAATPAGTDAAIFVRIVDGANEQYRYCSSVNIYAADAESFDVSALLSMPVAATLLAPQVVSPVIKPA